MNAFEKTLAVGPGTRCATNQGLGRCHSQDVLSVRPIGFYFCPHNVAERMMQRMALKDFCNLQRLRIFDRKVLAHAFALHATLQRDALNLVESSLRSSCTLRVLLHKGQDKVFRRDLDL